MNLLSSKRKLLGIALVAIPVLVLPVILLQLGRNQDVRQRASELQPHTTHATSNSGSGIIYGFLYFDTNNNQKIDEKETRTENVRVQLKLQDGSEPISSSVSDKNGYYGFGGLDTSKSFIIQIVPDESLFLLDPIEKTVTFDGKESIRQNFRYQFNKPTNLSEIEDSDLDLNENGIFDKADLSIMYLCVKERKNCITNLADINHDGILGGIDDLNIMIRQYNKIDTRKIR